MNVPSLYQWLLDPDRPIALLLGPLASEDNPIARDLQIIARFCEDRFIYASVVDAVNSPEPLEISYKALLDALSEHDAVIICRAPPHILSTAYEFFSGQKSPILNEDGSELYAWWAFIIAERETPIIQRTRFYSSRKLLLQGVETEFPRYHRMIHT